MESKSELEKKDKDGGKVEKKTHASHPVCGQMERYVILFIHFPPQLGWLVGARLEGREGSWLVLVVHTSPWAPCFSDPLSLVLVV